MDPKQQLWLLDVEPARKESNRNGLSLSENDCRELGNLFADLLINFLNKKQEARDADHDQ
jgi:hypothetical protein